MKRHTWLKALLTALVLATGTFQAQADRQRVFGFTGEVYSFDRGDGLLVVEDSVFRVSEAIRIHKRGGAIGTLSDITPGTKVGFYPGTGRQTVTINEIWLLPRNWKGKPGYADD